MAKETTHKKWWDYWDVSLHFWTGEMIGDFDGEMGFVRMETIGKIDSHIKVD